MAAESTAKGNGIRLTQDQYNKALRLLSSEISPQKTNWRDLVRFLLGWFFMGLFGNCLITGLITIWSDTSLGKWLLIIAGASIFLIGVFGSRAFKSDDTDESKESSSFIRLARNAYRETAKLSNSVLAVVSLIWLGGIGILVHSVITAHQPSLLGLGLSFSWIIYAVILGYDRYRRQIYFSRVYRLRDQLERLQDSESKDITRQNLSVLVRAEENMTKSLLQELPASTAKTYFLAISTDVSLYLKELPPDLAKTILEAIHSLEIDPMPPGLSQSATGEKETFVIRVHTQEILYSVDSSKRLVRVTGIRPTKESEGPNA